MIKKIRSYYSIFGFKETIKKIIRYIIYYLKSRSENGVYSISHSEREKMVLKSKRVFILAESSYDSLNDESALKKIVNVLNNNGYSVSYIYIHGNKLHKQVPLSYYKKIDKINIKKIKICKDDIFIKADDHRSYLNIIKIAQEKGANIISYNNFLENEKKWKNENLILKSIKSKNERCSNEFYNNISIIVLNYNNKKIITRCVDSLINNNEKYNYEIIIVDNQSTDGSYEMLKQKYKNINIYKNSKNGCASGRNLGVKNSTKDYILFLDSDQWALNCFWLDSYLDIMQNDEKIGAIGWAAGWFDKKGYSHHTVDNFEYRYMPPMGLYRKDIGYLGTGGLIMKKSLFDTIKGFDIAYDPTCYEDTDLSLKIRNYGKEIVYCPYLSIQHLPHQTTKSGSHSHELLIKSKGDYFIEKWKKINPKLLKYRK